MTQSDSLPYSSVALSAIYHGAAIGVQNLPCHVIEQPVCLTPDIELADYLEKWLSCPGTYRKGLPMADTLLSKYVLDGGWSMLLLVPGSVVAVAVAMRTGWALRSSNLREIARALPSSVAGEPAAREHPGYLAAL